MKIDRKELVSTLSNLKPAIGVGGVVVELSHLWFDGSFVYACNGSFGIRKPFKADFTGGVPGVPLLGLLNSSAVKEVVIEPSGQAALAVKLGKSSSKLAALPVERKIWAYPSKIPTKNAAVLPATFLEGLSKVLPVKASPATRVEHHGVTVVVKSGDVLELYCTDSSSMARVVVEGVSNNQAAGSVFMLPRDFAEQVVAQTTDKVPLNVTADCIIAHLDDVTLYANIIDISGADDMAAIVSREEKKHPEALVIPEGLAEALKRAIILAGPEDAVVDLSLEKGGLKVVGSYKLGTLQETLVLDGTHPTAGIRVRARVVQRALEHAQAFSISKSSLLFRGEGNFSYVVASM